MTGDRTRCKNCIQKRKLIPRQIIKKNKSLLIFIGLLWPYAVFPGQFISGLDPNFYMISMVAAVLIMILVGFAIFLSLNPPKSDIKKEKISKKSNLLHFLIVNKKLEPIFMSANYNVFVDSPKPEKT